MVGRKRKRGPKPKSKSSKSKLIAYEGETLEFIDEYTDLTSRNLRGDREIRKLQEAGKAIIAAPGIVFSLKGGKKKSKSNELVTAELPKYDINLYQKIFERVDLMRGLILRKAEMITEVDTFVGPPTSIITRGDKISETMKNNIAFTIQWMRYKKFRTWLGDAIVCALWAGNSYTEIVKERSPEYPDPNQPVEDKTVGKSWRIHELKIIPPSEMRPVRNSFGDVIGYLQYPFRSTFTWLSVKQSEWLQTQKSAIFFEPDEILHLKINPIPGEAYGTSDIESIKDVLAIIVGMREDIGAIVKNFAAPTVMFRVGTDMIPASPATVASFRDNLQSQMRVSSNIVTSTMVEASVIETGKNVMNMEGYMDMMLRILFGSAGLPEIMMGQGNETTEATGKMQMEAMAKQVRALHQVIKDEVELHIFSFLITGKKYSELVPSDLDKIPELHFGSIESTEEKRLRLQDDFRYGLITREEARKEKGMAPEPEGELTPEADKDYQVKLAKSRPIPTAGNTPGNTQSTAKAKKKPQSSTQKPDKAKPK